jgi:hypothetical protein
MTAKDRSVRDPRPPTAATTEKKAVMVHALVIFTHTAFLIILYGQTYGFDYVYFDDYEYVLANSFVSSGLTAEGIGWSLTSFYQANWHPLTWLSHMLDVSLFGVDPGWAHIHNMLLHGVNGLLVYGLFIKFSGSYWKACAVSLIFLVHPLHVESVAWIAERKDLLCAFFFLLGLLLYDHYRQRPGKLRYFTVVAAHALALTAKPMAVTFPVVLLILDYFVYQKSFQTGTESGSGGKIDYSRAIIEKTPFIAFSAASCVVTIIAQNAGHALSHIEKHTISARWTTATSAYLIYLKQFLFPVDLAAFYPLSASSSLSAWILPSVTLLVLIILITMFLPAFPLITAGAYFYLVTLLPVIGLVQVGGQAHADRYMYLPSIGLLMICIYFIPSKSKKYYQLGGVLSILFILYLSLISYWQIGYWENRYTLFSRVLDINGPNYRAYVHLAGHHLNNGMLEDARRQGLAAMALEPESSVAYRLMGHVALAEGEFQAAEQLYRLALERGDHSAELQNNLGLALVKQGKTNEGLDALRRAVEIEPNLAGAKTNLEIHDPIVSGIVNEANAIDAKKSTNN